MIRSAAVVQLPGFGWISRCPFLALSLQQGAANRSKGQHKAKAKNRSIFAGAMLDPATSSRPPQSVANDACAAC
jgi:hypothetical protein